MNSCNAVSFWPNRPSGVLTSTSTSAKRVNKLDFTGSVHALTPAARGVACHSVFELERCSRDSCFCTWVTWTFVAREVMPLCESS